MDVASLGFVELMTPGSVQSRLPADGPVDRSSTRSGRITPGLTSCAGNEQVMIELR